MKQIAWIVLGWLALTASSQAASFDCSKAASIVEKLICGDSELSKLDDELSVAYKTALKDKKQSEAIKQGQKKWIVDRDSCEGTFCVKDKYLTRLVAIQLAREFKSDDDVCQTMADYYNRGESQYFLRAVDIRPLDATSQEVMHIFGIGDTWSQNNISDSMLWKLDLNGDGIADYFAQIVYRSTPNFINEGYFLSGTKGSAVLGITDSDGNPRPISGLITVGGRNYIQAGNELIKVTKDDKFKPVCSLIRRSKPLLLITRGEANPICSAISSYDVRHVDFKSENITMEENITITGSAKVELDNDGKPENVAMIHSEGVVGPNCVSSEIKIVDSSNIVIPDSNINRIFSNFLNDCNVNQSVFIYDGLTYIDEQSSEDGSRAIILIKNGEGQRVCDFKGRILFDVEQAK